VSHDSSEATTGPRISRVAVLLTAATFAAVDLGAKAVSEERLVDSTVDLGLLELQLAYNSGVAFSLGDRLPVGVILAITGIILLAFTVYAWRRAPLAGWAERIAGGAVIGGAAANVFDRARDGVVTDYLHTGWWPTFNLADTFLVTGMIVIAVLNVREERNASDAQPGSGNPIEAAPHQP
jgi:signal peptidase II